jgi:hypothetical protein
MCFAIFVVGGGAERRGHEMEMYRMARFHAHFKHQNMVLRLNFCTLAKLLLKFGSSFFLHKTFMVLNI